MFTTYLPFLLVLGIPLIIAVAFGAWMWRARKPCRGMWWNTMPKEETFYTDLDKPNGLFRL